MVVALQDLENRKVANTISSQIMFGLTQIDTIKFYDGVSDSHALLKNFDNLNCEGENP